MANGRQDLLVRLSIGLPDPGFTVGDEPVLTASLRAALYIDAFTSSHELRVAEVLSQKTRERSQSAPGVGGQERGAQGQGEDEPQRGFGRGQ